MKQKFYRPINKTTFIVILVVAIILAIFYLWWRNIPDVCFWPLDCKINIDSHVNPGPTIDLRSRYPMLDSHRTLHDSITGKHRELAINEIHPIYATDFSNDRRLMGASHNVVVARILKEISNTPLASGIPATQFEAEVLYNIKGNLNGNIVINQQGGYVDGVLNIVGEGNDPQDYLLEPKKTYLLATRYSADKNRYTLISHPNARKLLSGGNLNNESLAKLVENDSRVRELKGAYLNEILLDVDVQHNTTFNSYESLYNKR